MGVAFLLALGTLLEITPAGARPEDSKPSASSSEFCPVTGGAEVTKAIKPIVIESRVPAMAAAMVTDSGLKFVGAAGVRKRGTKVPVGLNDLWHLGSDTKVMTSTVLARLIERGKLKWDSTLGEIFPDLASGMDEAFRKTPLVAVLSHQAGLPANLNWGEYRGADLMAVRRRVVRDALAKPPSSAVGEKFLYSNLGYVIAGAAVEQATGQSWEKTIEIELFKPLEMTSAGFGGTGTPGKIDQPWPHLEDGTPTRSNGPDMDNLPVMGPAGRVHCTIQDWAKFVRDQLRGARGEPALLKPESYKKIQTPVYGTYAMGWGTGERAWADGPILTHAGDNTMNHAVVWIAPKRNFAVLVCVNQGDTAEPCDKAVGAMIHLISGK